MFSVVIPVYNKAPYVVKAIESVLAQTYTVFELIVIDDGSTDGSAMRIEAFQDSRMRLVYQQNQGVSIARNQGARLARFEYVAFLDADDWWAPTFLAEMAMLVAECPEAGLYGSGYSVVKNGKNRLARIGVPTAFERGYIDYFSVYANTFWVPINCSFVVVKKTVFNEEYGFKPSLKFGEDFDLWLRIALRYQVAYVNKPLAYSNQDADPTYRALGSDKIWRKEEHVIFNLDYLNTYSSLPKSVTYLLDGLKLRSLEIFYLRGLYLPEIKRLLQHVDWMAHPIYFRNVYTRPKAFVNAYFAGKAWAYQTKEWLTGRQKMQR